MVKYKSLIIPVLVFAVVYSILIIVISPFLISWGDKPNFLGKIIDFLMTFPINWRTLITERSLLYVLPNGIFWGFVLAAITYLLKRIF